MKIEEMIAGFLACGYQIYIYPLPQKGWVAVMVVHFGKQGGHVLENGLENALKRVWDNSKVNDENLMALDII